MKHLIELLIGLYARLLHLYPRRFREEFADEMQGVFEQVLNDSVSAPKRLLLTSLREFGVLPASLLREHWREWTRAAGGLASLDDERPSPWTEAFLAGLPFGLLLLAFIVPFGQYTGPLIIGLTLLAVLVAWRKGWPRWSAGWLGLLLFVLVAYLSSFIYGLAGEWNTPRTLAANLIGEVLLPVGLGAGLYAIYQRAPLKGMLIVLFLLSFMDLFALEFVPDPLNTLVRVWCQLVVMATAIWLARRGTRTAGTVLMVGASILVGLALSIAGEYGNSYTNFDTPQAVDVMRNFLPNMLSSVTLLIGPLLLRAVWDLGRRSGTLGIYGHRFAWLGLALILAGQFGSYRLFLPDDISAFRESAGVWFMIGTWTGAALYVVGLALTGFAARRSGRPLSLPLYSLLALLLLASPLMWHSSRIIATRSLPIIGFAGSGLTAFDHVSDLWVLRVVAALGLLWLALSIGLLALVSYKPSPGVRLTGES